MEKKVKISILEGKREFEMEKNSRNFHFGKKKRHQNGKNSRNFHFGQEKRVQNEKNSRNFHFGKKKRVQNGKNSQNFHFEIKVWVHLAPTISYNKNPLMSGSNSKIVISEKSILSNYPKLHKRGEKI